MSDDDEDYYDDDDEYFWLDDGPVAEADDLAQHTIASPVWQDYNPDQVVGESFSDWEYYSDDYYDHVPEATSQGCVDEDKAQLYPGKKRKSAGHSGERAKRRRMDITGTVPRFSLDGALDSNSAGTPLSGAVVCWKKSDTFTAHPLPLLANDDGEKVALLSDWKDRFKIRLKDDIKELEPESTDYEVPVMKGGLLVIERGSQADGSKDADDSANRVEVEQKYTESTNHTRSNASSPEVPTIRNGVVIEECGVHRTVPRKAKAAFNDTKSKKRHADMDEEPDLRQTKRKAIATSDTKSGVRTLPLPTKSVARKRRLDDPPEPIEQTEIALRNQESLKNNLQHDAKAKVSLPDKESDKLSEAGKENGGIPQAPATRRSKRAKQGS